MRQLLIILLILISTISHGQEIAFELKKINFRGLEFSTTREKVIQLFGKGSKVETNYECGFFTNDHEGGPYYQLKYVDFTYIGSDKSNFYLQQVAFDPKGKIKINYGAEELTGRTTRDEFEKMFGITASADSTKDSILLHSIGSDDGAIFTFKDNRLIRFEYWTPC